MKVTRQVWLLGLCGPAVLLLASCASMKESTVVFETIALSGDPAPGDGNPFGRKLEPAVINNAGEVAFLASASGTGIWFGTGDSLALVARKGALAPGTGGANFSDFSRPSILVNDKGEVAFLASLEGPGVTDENDVGIWAGKCGRLALVARDGDIAPGTDGASFAFGFGGVFSQLSFNNKGKVAFRTGLVRNGVAVPGGIFVGDSRSGEFIVRVGDPAPGTGGAKFNGLGIGSAPLSDSGEIAFRGELEGPGVSGGNDLGIWFGAKNTLTLVARTSDIAPGTDGLLYADELSNPPILNSNGKVGFTSELKPARSTTGAWSRTPEKTSLIARTGDVAPGTDGARFAGFDEFGGRLFAFNNRADFAIFAGFTGPGMDPGSGGGVWLGTRNRLALVARTGDIAPGTGGATFDGLVLGKIDINDDRQIASAARTSAGDVGLWISSERRKLELVALQGSEFEIAPDDKRTIARFQGQPGPDGVSDFFDFGNRGLVFALDFTDGTSGIFTARLSHHRTAEIQ